MAVARSIVVDPTESGWYHCVTRCVRGAYLCGDEFDHRRGWICERLMELTGLFTIEVGGYTVMGNHYHTILHASPDRAARLSAEEVARRWLTICPGSRRFHLVEPSRDAIRQLAANRKRIADCRARLSDLSWLMRCLNEWVARRANAEDGRTGRFWEGRFGCRRLLDVTARLACSVYVDLNPIRAALATTPEGSDFTSVQDRIAARQHFLQSRDGVLDAGTAPAHIEDGLWLLPIDQLHSDATGDRPAVAEMPLDQYLELVDATGRIIRDDKRGSIPQHLQPILERLQIDEERWTKELARTAGRFGNAVGSAASRATEAARRGKKWVARVLDVYRGEPDLPSTA